MKKSILLVGIFLLLTGTAMADCTKMNQVLTNWQNLGFVMDYRYGGRELHINPTVWAQYTLTQKENLLFGYSKMKAKCKGSSIVKFLNGYSGEMLGEVSAFRARVYR